MTKAAITPVIDELGALFSETTGVITRNFGRHFFSVASYCVEILQVQLSGVKVLQDSQLKSQENDSLLKISINCPKELKTLIWNNSDICVFSVRSL